MSRKRNDGGWEQLLLPFLLLGLLTLVIRVAVIVLLLLALFVRPRTTVSIVAVLALVGLAQRSPWAAAAVVVALLICATLYLRRASATPT